MPSSTGKHRQWLTKVPSDTIKIRELWELEHVNRRKVMQQRADVRANKEAEERRAKKEQQARYMAMCKAARRHRRALARQHRNEVRFARTLEEERVHQRAQAGDKWVERRMCHTSDLQKMASEIKLENAQLRQQQMKHRWDKMEQERLVRQQNNRVVMLDRLRPLTALGTDVAALITTSLPSPMEQRMAAIADIHAIRSRKQRSDMHVALARSKEKQQLTDLSCTRTTAENRAEQHWLMKLEEKGLSKHGSILDPPPLGVSMYDDDEYLDAPYQEQSAYEGDQSDAQMHDEMQAYEHQQRAASAEPAYHPEPVGQVYAEPEPMEQTAEEPMEQTAAHDITPDPESDQEEYDEDFN